MPLDWPLILNTVIALLIVAGVSGVVTLVVQGLRGKLVKQPAFKLRDRGSGVIELERTSRRTAFAVQQGDGIASGSAFGAMLPMYGPANDMKHADRTILSMPNQEGFYVWLMWVEGGDRYYTRSQFVKPGTDELVYFPIKGEIGKPWQT